MFLISRIKSLGFAYVSNRFLCYFTVKVNGLTSITCVSFNMSASTSTTLISATSSIYIIKKKKKKHCVSYQNENPTPRLTPHYQSTSNRQSSSTKTTKNVRSVASATKNYLEFFFSYHSLCCVVVLAGLTKPSLFLFVFYTNRYHEKK